jgi:hypothetical protein
MEPKSLSATGLQVYMECPARFKAEYIQRVRFSSGGGTAGDMGSLIHEVLEWWVVTGRFNTTGFGPMEKKCKECAPNYGVDALQIKVAVKMLQAWYDRWGEQEANGPAFEVLQAEVKESFTLKAKDSAGVMNEVGVTYIWDRVDRLMEDGSIRVVDYKSWMKFMTGDEIFHYLQVRLYALAAAIKYKDQEPPYIWVQLDQLRYGLGTAVRFSRDDIRDIWAWLKATYISILEDPGDREVVGNGCRFCVRSSSCQSFANAVAAGTVLAYKDPEDAARKVAEINSVLGALQDTKGQLLAYLETHLEERGYLEERFESGVTLKITPKRSRSVDQAAAMDAIGAETAARFGKLGVTVIDELLEGNELTDEQKDRLRKAVTESVTTSVNAFFK